MIDRRPPMMENGGEEQIGESEASRSYGGIANGDHPPMTSALGGEGESPKRTCKKGGCIDFKD